MSRTPDHGLVVVDDEPGFCNLVRRVATSCGFESHATTNPAQFLKCLRQRQYAVVLLDLKMPGIDGVEVLRELAAIGTSAKILLASGLDQSVLDTALRLGHDRGLDMAGVVRKPVRVKELRMLLEQLKPQNRPIDSGALEAAVEHGELVLHYQPRLDLRTRRIVGVEALVRWQHPDLGLLPPGDFVPLAERSSLINRLTDWVAATAIGQCGHWHRQELDLGIAVNLSASNITDYRLPDRFEHLCATSRVDPAIVTIELTETAAMHDFTRLMDVFARFRLKGFRLALDDFGIGYASLAQLRRLPFSELKIDKSFVGAMTESTDNAKIVDAAISMARSLRISAVAEGVETAQALEVLTTKGCHFAQGYHIAPPLAVELIPKAVRAVGH
jgi:EAL domain-containing protein (putative c-di-GMP-specific phosphodiesterase class I)